MTTARLVSLFLSFSLAAAAVHAEPFEVWEDSGAIWGRDLAGGEAWRLSRGANAHSPDLDGPLAVWVADWSYQADIMGGYLDGRWPVDFAISVRTTIQSNPQVSFIGTAEAECYTVWQEPTGLWANRIGHDGTNGELMVPGYTGAFTLECKTLTWDGGSLELPYFQATPEPSALMLLAIAVICLGWRRHG